MIHVVLKDGTSICSCFISVLQRSFRIEYSVVCNKSPSG